MAVAILMPKTMMTLLSSIKWGRSVEFPLHLLKDAEQIIRQHTHIHIYGGWKKISGNIDWLVAILNLSALPWHFCLLHHLPQGLFISSFSLVSFQLFFDQCRNAMAELRFSPFFSSPFLSWGVATPRPLGACLLFLLLHCAFYGVNGFPRPRDLFT